MNKQTVILICVALGLAILYIANFTDWLKPKKIQVFWRISPASGQLAFYLDKSYPLTSVEVVSTEEGLTNKHPHALWHIVAQKGGVSIGTFTYGMTIPGMAPEISTALPEPLQPGTDYSLLVEAGSGLKGEKSFKLQ
jgi:phosphate/sulfate permease